VSKSDGQWIDPNIKNSNQSSTKINFKELTESELYPNLAQNIVREIYLINNEKLEEMTPKCTSKDLVKNVLRIPTRKVRRSYSKEVKQLSDLVLMFCIHYF
jgi:hypothetical protein